MPGPPVFQWYSCTVHGEVLVVPVPDNIIYNGYNDKVTYTELLLPLFSYFWRANGGALTISRSLS